FESDIELAKLLKKEWGVDLIIGGHSHTILKHPKKTNKILITQAGVGTDQIGRYDIEVDDSTNSIIKYNWQLIPIDSKLAEPDEKLERFIDSFKKKVDRKYNTILTKLAKKHTHPVREEETSLGNLFADGFAQMCECDVMLIGSGSIRIPKLGPVVTLKDFISCFPFDDTLTRFKINGSQLKKIFNHIMRNENRNDEGECYQVNSSVKATFSTKSDKLKSLKVNAKPVTQNSMYTLCLQGYHFKNSKDYLNITEKELIKSKETKVVTTSAQEMLEEFLRNNQNISREIEGRLVYLA
ncbi:MAG: 5'-nucleotidase C-terminal domain-containing protein, partial [Candidatus Dojkabacteria bacterium]|nr:5'-nucleotidase C-terminal domain-containing protein [Candidatus Dojkabacteria bacterium]